MSFNQITQYLPGIERAHAAIIFPAYVIVEAEVVINSVTQYYEDNKRKLI